MLPKIIVHNSVSADGSLTNFEPDMRLHYKIAGNYKPDVHLIGSNTIKTGIEMFGGEVPPEEENDFIKQKRVKSLPLWVIIDTKGDLKGLLHTCRRFEFCRDVIVLVSEKTPETYLDHLSERNYDYLITGKDTVDLTTALNLLYEKYHVNTILTDTGRVLGNILISQGFVEEISLLLHPVIVGNRSYNMFSDMMSSVQMKLKKCEVLDNDCVWLVYRVVK